MKRTAIVLGAFLFVANAVGGAAAAPAKKKHHKTAPPRPSPVAAPAGSEPAPTATPGDAGVPSDAGTAPASGAAQGSEEPAANAPAATPAPASPPASTPSSGGKAVDLEALDTEYQQLRDELFRSRAKANLVGNALFKTRLLATFEYEAQRAWPIKKVTLRVDDQPVFTADSPQTADPLKLYDGFAAPGRHTVALRVECGATGEDRVAYGAEGSFVIDVAENKETRIALIVDESGDGPQKLARKRAGDFDVRVRAKVEQRERK